MKNRLLTILSLVAIVGCSSIPNADLSVVDVEKNRLIQQWANYSKIDKQKDFYKLIKTEYGYTQPLNKKNECKVPIMKYPGFRDFEHEVYWDGNCKGGYGVGLGRIIVKSSYDHIELIIDLHQNGRVPLEYLYWFRDYVAHSTEYGLDQTDGECFIAIEKIFSSPTIRIINSLNVGTLEGNYLVFNVADSLNGEQNIVMYQNPVYYYQKINFNDITSPMDYNMGMLSTQDNMSVGVNLLKLKNGETIHFLVNSNTLVNVPSNYFDDMNRKLDKARTLASEANNNAQQAKNLYETYMYKACNNDNSNDGIDTKLYHKICDYELQMQDTVAQVYRKIESDRNHKLDQITQERLIRAREIEAKAAEQRAQIAKERANANLDFNMNKTRLTTCTNFGFGVINCSTY